MGRSPISVIIPTYNRASMIAAAIDSVLDQCRDDDEIIVVDDGSTDNTSEVIAKYGPRLNYIRQANSGAGAARNRGIDAAKHDLIAFLDSDDEFLPGRIDLQAALMDARPDLVFSFGDFRVRHADGRITPRYLKRWHKDPRPWSELLGAGVALSSLTSLPEGSEDVFVHIGDLYALEMAASYVSTIVAMVRRSRAGDAMFFTENIPLYEDWGFFGRLAGRGPVAFIDRELALNGGHFEGRLTDADMHVRADARIVVLQEVWGADPAFLEGHGDDYRKTLEEQQVIQAGGLISRGRTAEARRVLAQVRHAPLGHRILAALPGPLARSALRLRRLVLSIPHGG